MRIDVHTHLFCADFIKHLQSRSSLPNTVIEGGKIITCMPNFRHVAPGKSWDLEEKLREEELMGIDFSVLSHGLPGPELLGGPDAECRSTGTWPNWACL
jgi:hypothetical protein